mmetsp:Transcript_20308/g.38048  ORF Transcript_20308/g.38048 Transcript_20308/m.38048 type:complete len:120 (+) Transcript_20308:300-659(+)
MHRMSPRRKISESLEKDARCRDIRKENLHAILGRAIKSKYRFAADSPASTCWQRSQAQHKKARDLNATKKINKSVITDSASKSARHTDDGMEGVLRHPLASTPESLSLHRTNLPSKILI